MTQDDLTYVQSILDRISYKPGWRLLAGLASGEENIDIRVYFDHMPNVDKLDEKAQILFRKQITPKMITRDKKGDRLLVHVVKDSIRLLELHEMDEWLKVDGKRLIKLHPEQRDEEIWTPLHKSKK